MSISNSIRRAVENKYDGLCGYCGVKLAEYPNLDQCPEQYCIDHIVPKASGGTDNIDNLMPACRTCNSKKGPRSLEKFRHRLAWLDLCGVIFSPTQTEALKYLGFEIPTPEKDYKFFFENYG